MLAQVTDGSIPRTIVITYPGHLRVMEYGMAIGRSRIGNRLTERIVSASSCADASDLSSLTATSGIVVV